MLPVAAPVVEGREAVAVAEDLMVAFEGSSCVDVVMLCINALEETEEVVEGSTTGGVVGISTDEAVFPTVVGTAVPAVFS